MSTWTDDFGNELIYVHEEGTCHGPACPIHRPSDHPLKNAKQMWRQDKGIMERVCDHGVGHPDPDDYKASAVVRMHGCDGCCVEWLDSPVEVPNPEVQSKSVLRRLEIQKKTDNDE